MAVAYQTGVATNSAANVSTLTSASMTVSGSNTYLLALVVSGAGSPVDPVSCKWGGSGGTAMTKVGTTLTLGPYWKATLYELVAPAAGANTLYVDYGTNQDETGVIGVLYTGVDQTTPRGTVGTGYNDNSRPQSATCTTVAGDTVVGAIFIGTDISGFSDSQTVRQSWAEIAAGYELASVGDKTASGTSTTVNWNTTYTSPWGAFAVPLKAAAGGTTYNDTISEGVTLGESHAADLVMAALSSEGLTLSASLAAGLRYTDSLSEGTTLGTDYAVAAVRDTALSEGLTLGVGYATAQTFVEALSAGVTLGDGLAPGLVLAATLAEAVTFGDNFASTVTKDETIAESVTLGDGFAATLAAVGTVSEGLTFGADLLAAATYPAALSEGVTLGVPLVDEHIQGGVYNDTLGETLALDASFSTTLVAGAVLAEGIVLDASFYTPPLGQSVRSGGGGGGGRAWGWELDREVEEEMGVLLEGPPLTPATIEAVARRLDAPAESRIIGLKQPPVPAVSFDAAMVRRRRIRRRLLLLL